MAAPEAYSRSALTRARLWQPIKNAWAWLAPFGATALPARTYAVLALIVLALHLPGQFSIPATDRDESRYAEATKQMMLSGDFLDIRLGDQPRYVQPAGIYWLQAVATAPFGGPHAPIWAYRLPSILSALASVLLLAWFGTRVASPAVGVSAALLLASSLLLTAEAHIAKIDSTLLLSILGAQVALFLSLESKERPAFVGWPLVFWIALAAGALLKGPIVFVVSGLTLLSYAIWNREPGAVLRLRPLFGVPLFALILAPWLLLITLKTHGEFLNVAIGQSIGGKLAGTSDRHSGPPGYHLLVFMLTFFPGIALAGLGGVHAFLYRSERLVRYLVCWIVPTWLAFELIPTKLPHYVLPVFPAIALLVALAIKAGRADLTRGWARWVHRAAGVLFVIAALVLAALPFVAARQFGMPAGVPSFVAAAGILAVALAGVSLWVQPTGSRLLPLVAAMCLAYVAMFQMVIPALDPLWASDRIAKRLDHLSGCAPIEVATAGYAEPSNLFHFGPETFLGANGAATADFIAAHKACSVAIVESSQRPAFLAAASAKGLGLMSLGQIAGFNYVKGKRIELEILLPQGSDLHIAP